MIKFKANPPPTEGTWKIGETEVPVGGDQGSFKSGSFLPGVCIFFQIILKIFHSVREIFFKKSIERILFLEVFFAKLLAAVEKIYENIQIKYNNNIFIYCSVTGC